MAQISLVPLQEWIECPLLPTTTALPAPVDFTGTDELILTPDGSTFNGAPSFNGRLPNAAELNGAPFYHLLIRAYTQTPPVVAADSLVVSVDGERYGAALELSALEYETTALISFVPSETEELAITAQGLPNSSPTTVVVAFLVPTFPQNLNGEDLSLDQILRWQNAPLRPFAQTQLPLTAGAPPRPLVLPSAVQRDGAPWAYLDLTFEGATPANASGVLLYANGEPVAAIGFNTQGAPFVTVRGSQPDSSFVLKPTDFRFRYPLDGVTYAVQAITQNVTVDYSWLVPDVPEVP